MRNLIFFLVLIIPSFLFSQDYSKEFLEKSLQNAEAYSVNYLDTIVHRDLSILWLPDKYQKYNLGYIGSKYQRFKIHFNSIIKDPENPEVYLFYGKSKVKENICEFLGTVKLLHARKFISSEIENIIQGFVIFEYDFFENPNQSHSGIFKGIGQSNWMIDRNSNLAYDDLEIAADGYSNNEFVGIWSDYASKNKLTCNWAHFRIPYSGDLDVGVGSFFPNEKYMNNGWKEYSNSNYPNGAESQTWWDK